MPLIFLIEMITVLDKKLGRVGKDGLKYSIRGEKQSGLPKKFKVLPIKLNIRFKKMK